MGPFNSLVMSSMDRSPFCVSPWRVSNLSELSLVCQSSGSDAASGPQDPVAPGQRSSAGSHREPSRHMQPHPLSYLESNAELNLLCSSFTTPIRPLFTHYLKKTNRKLVVLLCVLETFSFCFYKWFMLWPL